MAHAVRQMNMLSATGTTSAKDTLDGIKGRVTPEIVIGVCGAIGSGASTISEILHEAVQLFDYEAKIIKLSAYIQRFIAHEEPFLQLDALGEADRYEKFQDAGNQLRETHSYDVLAQLAISEISIDRESYKKKCDAKRLPTGGTVEGDEDYHEPWRRITIIDGLKHPAEWELLRMVYGRMFYLVGVLCPEAVRQNRLTHNKHFKKADAIRIIDRDKGEKTDYGQHLVDTMHRSDFFVRNVVNSKAVPRPAVERFISLLLGNGKKHTPTPHEYAMQLAQASSCRSSCLSRKVGASIVGAHGEVLAAGRNDVPKAGGSLYDEDDEPRLNCSNGDGCATYNYKEKMKSDIDGSLRNSFSEASSAYIEKILAHLDEASRENVKKAIENDKSLKNVFDSKELAAKVVKTDLLKGITEYSRAVHAEMDAITTASRCATGSLRDATLYVTTFPCHNCVKHILASGITRVFYIEPYEKSLASPLYHDSLTLEADTDEPESGRLKILPFEGVAPRRYLNLFAFTDTKVEGKANPGQPSKATPTVTKLMDSFIEYEGKVQKVLAGTELRKIILEEGR